MNCENNERELYKKMYYRLFNLVSDVIVVCDDERAKNKLIAAQETTEEMYMNGVNSETNEKRL